MTVSAAETVASYNTTAVYTSGMSNKNVVHLSSEMTVSVPVQPITSGNYCKLQYYSSLHCHMSNKHDVHLSSMMSVSASVQPIRPYI